MSDIQTESATCPICHQSGVVTYEVLTSYLTSAPLRKIPQDFRCPNNCAQQIGPNRGTIFDALRR
jgi:hypothetical protein